MGHIIISNIDSLKQQNTNIGILMKHSEEYFFSSQMKGIRKLIQYSINECNAQKLGKESIRLNDTEITQLFKNLGDEITQKLKVIPEKGIKDYGNLYNFKKVQIKLDSNIRNLNERILIKMIKLYNFIEVIQSNNKKLHFIFIDEPLGDT